MVSLSFLDFTELIRSTPFGPMSFPLIGLADLPQAERELVIDVLTTPPVNGWLDVSVVQTMPDSPFVVTHVETSISDKYITILKLLYINERFIRRLIPFILLFLSFQAKSRWF